MNDERLALFVMLGKTAEQKLANEPFVAPSTQLLLSPGEDLSRSLPDLVRNAQSASVPFMLFFVFENYLRDLIVEVLSEEEPNWWEKVPVDIKEYVRDQEEREEVKQWMQIGSREKLALVTYPQLIDIIDKCWKDGFDSVVRDKALIHQARVVSHLRNATCHMHAIPEEETARVRLVIRDWFRAAAP
jgi:Swt1-like HEPN